PRNPYWATATQLDLVQTLDSVLAIVKAADADTLKIRRELRKLDKILGTSLRDGLLKRLGPTFVFYDTPDNAGVFFTGITIIAESSEGEDVRAELAKIVKAIAQAAGGAKQTSVKREEYRDHVIEFVNVTGVPMPVAPAWATHGKWIILGVYPQTVRSAIDR